MPKEYNRTTRIADLIQKELAIVLQQEIADQRLRFITITFVKVSKDLAFADILFTQLDSYFQGQPVTKEITVKLLKKASSRLRYCLAQRLRLRVIPELRFFYDDLNEQGQRLHDLIDKALTKDKVKRSE